MKDEDKIFKGFAIWAGVMITLWFALAGFAIWAIYTIVTWLVTK
jgi:hypothetical protein